MSDLYQVTIENPEALEVASIRFTKALFDVWYDRQFEEIAEVED